MNKHFIRFKDFHDSAKASPVVKSRRPTRIAVFYVLDNRFLEKLHLRPNRDSRRGSVTIFGKRLLGVIYGEA
jgi:hypothetical protein